VRLTLKDRNSVHDEPHPIPSFAIDHQYLAIKVKQGIKRGIAMRHNGTKSLSDNDNYHSSKCNLHYDG
jgi:hypothetical protein